MERITIAFASGQCVAFTIAKTALLYMGMMKIWVFAILFSSFLLPTKEAFAEEPSEQKILSDWQKLKKGLAYKHFISSSGSYQTRFRLHVFRVDLKHYKVVVADARQKEFRKRTTVDVLANEVGAHLAINGTFFDPQERPLGLLIQNDKRLNLLRYANWGVFFVQNGKAYLVHTKKWIESWDKVTGIDFAIQVGPRVVEAGKALVQKSQFAHRGAICILPDNLLLVAVSHAAPVESNDLANIMANSSAAGGLGCQDALMVDGGSSVQLYVQVDSFQLFVTGQPVPNAVAFVPR